MPRGPDPAVAQALDAALRAASTASRAAGAVPAAQSGRKKKRTEVKIKDKQKALELLGALPDGSFGPPQQNPDSGKAWTGNDVAKKFNVAKNTVSSWRKSAKEIMKFDVSRAGVHKSLRMKQGQYPQIEKAVYNYIRQRTLYNKNESPFREHAIRKIAWDVRDEMVTVLSDSMSKETDAEEKAKLATRIQSFENFRASHGWFSNFMKRNDTESRKGAGQAGHYTPAQVDEAGKHNEKDLGEFTRAEDSIECCRTVSEGKALAAAVADALGIREQSETKSNTAKNDTGSDTEEIRPAPSFSRYKAAAEAFRKELSLLLSEGSGLVDTALGSELMNIVDMEIDRVEEIQSKNRGSQPKLSSSFKEVT